MRDYLRERYADAVAAGFVLVLFFPVLCLGKTLWFFDVTLNFFPNALHHIHRLREGAIPLWTTRIYGGFPFAADPVQAVFHPLKLFYLLPADPVWLVNAFAVLCFLVAASGMVRLARSLGTGEAGAATASLAFTGSGAFLSHSYLNNFLLAFVFIPWMLAAAVRAARSGGNAWLAVAAFGSLSLLAGDPQAFVLSFFLAGLIILPDARRQPVLLLRLGAASAAAFLLAAVQWLPTLLFTPETVRGGGDTLARSLLCSSHPARYLEFLFPQFYGLNTRLATLWAGGLFCRPGGGATNYFSSYHMGLVPLVLAGAGIATAGLRRWMPWAALGLLAALLSFGETGKLFVWAWTYVPYWHHFRLPERYVPWLVLCLAVLAGQGAAWAVREENRRRAGFLLAVTAALVAAASRATGFWLDWAGQWTPVDANALGETVPHSLDLAGLFALPVFAAGLLLRSEFRWRTPALLAATALPLYMNGLPVISWIPAAETLGSRPAVIAELPAAPGPVPLRLWTLPVRFPVQFPREAPFWLRYTVYWHLLDMDVPLAVNGTPGVDSVTGYNSFVPANWDEVTKDLAPENEIRLFDASAVVSMERDPDTARYGTDRKRFLGPFSLTLTGLAPSRAVCPEAWRLGTRPDALAAVRAEGFDPRKLLVAEGPSGPLQPRSGPAARCEVTRYESELVEIAVSQSDAAPVALLDANFSGWTATVNGTETPVLTAWGIHRAVMAPAGESTIVFRYVTPGLATGASISLSAVLFLIALGFWQRRKAAQTSPDFQ